jgi:hypothetical protein
VNSREGNRDIDDWLVIAGEKAGGIAELANSHRNEIGLEELPRCLGSEQTRLDRASTDLLERRPYGSGVRRGLRMHELSAAVSGALAMSEPLAGVPGRLVRTELAGVPCQWVRTESIAGVPFGWVRTELIGRRDAVRGLRAKRDRAHDRTTAGVERCKSAGVIVAGPAVEIAPAGRLQRRIGNFQRPRLRGRGSRRSGPSKDFCMRSMAWRRRGITSRVGTIGHRDGDCQRRR